MSGVPWSKDDIRIARIALRGTTNQVEGLNAARKAVGRNFSWDALDRILARKTGKTAFSHLRTPPVEPVAAAVAREAKTTDKETIADLVEQVREAKERQAFLDATSKVRGEPKILPREKRSGLREMTSVALLSDLHVEEPVTLESVGGVNEYNMEIADTRLKRFFQGLRWNMDHHRADGQLRLRDLVLWLGGDFMSGFIHDDLVQSNELSPVETSLWLMKRIRDGIHTLLADTNLETITIPCSYGNHGRTTPKRRIQNGASNSYEWLFYNNLATHFAKERRIRFEITQSSHQWVTVYDKVLDFHHGDSVKYQGGVGGIAVPLLRAAPRWDAQRKADYHHVGHFHTISDFGKVLVNGSLIGFGPYSQEIGATPEAPAQLTYLLDSRRGKCQVTPIWVDELRDGRGKKAA